MLESWSALHSLMSRRLLLVVGCAVAVVLLSTVGLVARETSLQQQSLRQDVLDRAASGFAGAVSARLAAATEIATTLSAEDAGFNGQALRNRTKSTRAFSGVFLLTADSAGVARAGANEFHFTRAQLGTLLSGGTALLSVQLDAQLTGIFLARSVSEARVVRIAAFELAPDWLWSPLHDLPPGLSVVALDARGAAVHGGGEIASELAGLLVQGLGRHLGAGTNRHLGWQSHGEAWAGSVATLLPADAITSPPVTIVVAGRKPSFWASFDSIVPALPVLLTLATLSILCASAALGRSYVPRLRALRAALADMRGQRISQLRLQSTDDEVQQAIEAYNHAAVHVEHQLATLHAQSEIDTLLLGAAELEAVLDQVLVRLRDVMQARAVGITLIDGDAPGYGRLFVACADMAERPVSRVPLDASAVDLFASSQEGVTIVRCEEERHSFLMPLAKVGAEFFWAWPVFANDRLAAILSVGYGEAPRLDARLAVHGTDCARRLGTVLSRGARAERLYRQAHFDPLTQLPNRLLFRDRLEQALSAAAAASTRGALLYIDLDHFKKVNDTLGHAAGDQLLAIVAQRLRACVKEGDTVARLAGDEFTVILHQVTEPGAAMTVAQRVIEMLQMPVNLGGKDHNVRASIGITLFPDDGASIDDLMRHADLAMYRAKDQGRGTAAFFDRKMMTRDLRVPDTGLYRALKRREFSLFYQPQYNLSDGSLTGVEALLRWESPRTGMRSPAEFVPAAEECGLIVDIGSWVLEAACAQIASWRQQGLQLPRVAVNISSHQLHDPGCITLVKRMLDKYALQPDMLELELTESAFADPEAEAALQGIAKLGVRLALDDFGTGVSALNHLRRYPVRTVKIDRSFIDDVADNPASATLAEAIIAMAHTLGKQVVAEGVETVEQLEFLRERRCDVVQGYYLARPMAAAAMAELLAARRPPAEDHAAAAAG